MPLFASHLNLNLLAVENKTNRHGAQDERVAIAYPLMSGCSGNGAIRLATPHFPIGDGFSQSVKDINGGFPCVCFGAPVCVSVCLSGCISMCLPVCLSVCLPACLLGCLAAYSAAWLAAWLYKCPG